MVEPRATPAEPRMSECPFHPLDSKRTLPPPRRCNNSFKPLASPASGNGTKPATANPGTSANAPRCRPWRPAVAAWCGRDGGGRPGAGGGVVDGPVPHPGCKFAPGLDRGTIWGMCKKISGSWGGFPTNLHPPFESRGYFLDSGKTLASRPARCGHGVGGAHARRHFLRVYRCGITGNNT